VKCFKVKCDVHVNDRIGIDDIIMIKNVMNKLSSARQIEMMWSE
jgi:hypothetical protein